MTLRSQIFQFEQIVRQRYHDPDYIFKQADKHVRWKYGVQTKFKKSPDQIRVEFYENLLIGKTIGGIK